MSAALHSIERQISAVQIEASLRRDIHGRTSASYRQKRAELANLKQERWALKCALAQGNYGVVA